MANGFQRLIYNLSSTAPLCLIFSIVWYLQKRTVIVSAACFGAGLILIICFNISFSYGRKNIAPIAVRTNDISPHDEWVAIYIISYMLPFASMAIKDFDALICGIIATLLVLIAPYINTAIPNPLLFFRKYHFYKIGSESGMSGYVLISKRKLRKKDSVKSVKRIFEFLLLDTEEK